MRDSRRDTGLIIGYRDRDLRNALSQRFKHSVQPGMRDANCGLLQQLQLWHSLCDYGIVWNGSDLLRIDLIADRQPQVIDANGETVEERSFQSIFSPTRLACALMPPLTLSNKLANLATPSRFLAS